MNKTEKAPNSKGNKAIHYNENVERYAKSGKVEANAKKAVQALDNEDEAKALRKAEQVGKSRAKDLPSGNTSKRNSAPERKAGTPVRSNSQRRA